MENYSLADFERQKQEYYERMHNDFEIYELGDNIDMMTINNQVNEQHNIDNNTDNMQIN